MGADMTMQRTPTGWMCPGCASFAVDPEHGAKQPTCDCSFPGYERLLMAETTPPAIPGETLDAYFMRVYGRPYPHGDRPGAPPGSALAEAHR
jgi:hypothetical protein